MIAVNPAEPGFTVVMPVRPWRLAPTTLGPGAADRSRLARAFTLDVLLVLRAAPSVSAIVIVSDESDLPPEALGEGVTVLPDRALVATNPIDNAVRIGIRWASARFPDHPIVVVPADLPSITMPALESALGEMRSMTSPSFVADLSGRGSTLMGAENPGNLLATFGAGSAHVQRGAGLVRVAGADAEVRLDVDTVKDLSHAISQGVGPFTSAAINDMSR